MATLATSQILDASLADDSREEVKWVRVRGDMTSSEAVVDVARRLRGACGGIRRLVVDACGVDDLDTKFIALLVDLQRRAGSARVALEILPSPAVRKWLGICRLDMR